MVRLNLMLKNEIIIENKNMNGAAKVNLELLLMYSIFTSLSINLKLFVAYFQCKYSKKPIKERFEV